MTPKTRRGVVALALAAAVAAPALPSVAGTPTPSGDDLARVRAATARFHDVATAQAAGYVPGSPCETSPAGGMGVHYVNPELMADPALDPGRPEILLYDTRPDGELRLVGVEWWVPDMGQERPEILGVPFDGPMAGHAPGMPVHYDLHVWVWRNNPEGMTAQWNPNVTCGGGSR